MKRLIHLPWFALIALLSGCAHKAAEPVASAPHSALSPRLQALLSSPESQQKKEEELPELPREGLPDSTVEQLRLRIAALQFPLPAGTVLGLFPYDLMWSGRLDGDAFGDPTGYLGGTSTWYRLSPKFVLYLRQSHYSNPEHKMVTVDEGAEIVTIAEAQRRWPAEPEEKSQANQRPDGTSAEAPPSNPSQGAAVPHP